jgi:hypothetical protein
MAPEGQDHVTGQAYVVCNRNGIEPTPLVPVPMSRSLSGAAHTQRCAAAVHVARQWRQ